MERVIAHSILPLDLQLKKGEVSGYYDTTKQLQFSPFLLLTCVRGKKIRKKEREKSEIREEILQEIKKDSSPRL